MIPIQMYNLIRNSLGLGQNQRHKTINPKIAGMWKQGLRILPFPLYKECSAKKIWETVFYGLIREHLYHAYPKSTLKLC